MDKIDIRDLIVRELKNNNFGTTDQTGNRLIVVEDCDFVEIAESIVAKLPTYVIMQQRELLSRFLKYYNQDDLKVSDEIDIDLFLDNNKPT